MQNILKLTFKYFKGILTGKCDRKHLNKHFSPSNTLTKSKQWTTRLLSHKMKKHQINKRGSKLIFLPTFVQTLQKLQSSNCWWRTSFNFRPINYLLYSFGFSVTVMDTSQCFTAFFPPIHYMVKITCLDVFYSLNFCPEVVKHPVYIYICSYKYIYCQKVQQLIVTSMLLAVQLISIHL